MRAHGYRMKQRPFFPEDLTGRHHLMALHSPDKKLSVIPQLLCHHVIGDLTRSQPDDFTLQLIQPDHAFLVESDLRRLLDGERQIQGGIDQGNSRELGDDRLGFWNGS